MPSELQEILQTSFGWGTYLPVLWRTIIKQTWCPASRSLHTTQYLWKIFNHLGQLARVATWVHTFSSESLAKTNLASGVVWEYSSALAGLAYWFPNETTMHSPRSPLSQALSSPSPNFQQVGRSLLSLPTSSCSSLARDWFLSDWTYRCGVPSGTTASFRLSCSTFIRWLSQTC